MQFQSEVLSPSSMMNTNAAGSSAYRTTLCHNPEDQSAITRRLRKCILTKSHSTDVYQVPRKLSGYIPIFAGKKRRKGTKVWYAKYITVYAASSQPVSSREI